MEEAATQEGRAKQLEDEMKDLRSKHKLMLQEEMAKTELLKKVILVNTFLVCRICKISNEILLSPPLKFSDLMHVFNHFSMFTLNCFLLIIWSFHKHMGKKLCQVSILI